MQSADIIPFPPAGAQIAAWPDARPKKGRAPHPLLAGGTLVGIHYLARELKMPQAHARAVVRTVRALIAGHGFPLPNPRWQGKALLTGADAVSLSSLWKREEVDFWFASQSPGGPGGEAARAAAVDRDVADRLEGLAR